MTVDQQQQRKEAVLAVRSALSALRLCRVTDKEILAAIDQLENWLMDFDPRWPA